MSSLMSSLMASLSLSLSLSRLAAWQVALLQSHFHEHGQQSRVMVFCSYRYGACRSSFDGPESECMLMTSLIRYGVQELVRWLERVHGVRATQFIGQSKGKGENEKGMAQKEQRRVVKQFREGVFNVLVATSIGEEGLDIGAC